MKKEIPFKNYVILVLIFGLTVLAVFYMRSWYNTYKEYYTQNSVMTQVIMEIKSEELANYSLEDQGFILYVASGQNTELKEFEDEFKDLVKEMDLTNEMLYLNLDEVDPSSFYATLKSDFAADSSVQSQIDTSSSASMYLFTSGEITNVLNNVDSYSLSRLETIMNRWDVV